MTHFSDEQVTLEAIKAGAMDYIVKSPEAIATLPQTVARVLHEWRLLKECRQAETALRASEQRFRAVAYSANDAIIIADGAGKILDWNRGAGKIFGYAEAEAVGQPLTLLLPPRFHEGGAKTGANFRSSFRWRSGRPRQTGFTPASSAISPNASGRKRRCARAKSNFAPFLKGPRSASPKPTSAPGSFCA